MTLNRRSALDVLGLKADATDEDIKKAYRKKAMEHHPDRTGGDEKKFKDIQAAFDYLEKNPRDSYSRNGRDPSDINDFRDIMEDLFDLGKNKNPRSKIWRTTVAISLEEAFKGVSRYLNFDPLGKEEFLIIIKKGLIPNSHLRTIQGKDETGLEHIINVDVDIVTPHKVTWAYAPNLTGGAIEGSGNIECFFDVDWKTIMQGGWQTFTCVDGGEVNVRIPSGITTNTLLKIKGRGYWSDSVSDQRGDVLLRVRPIIPKLSDMTKVDLQEAIKMFNDVYEKIE
jgi:DnaJ-class molecular chaperone